MKCCICGMEIDQENRSEEHIIHNAIGGILKSDSIYCKKCNSKYGSDLDKAFTEIFAPIIDGLDMNFDRKTGKTSYEGIMRDKEGNSYKTYGSDLDKAFTEIFAPIIDGLDMNFDRKTGKTSYEGIMRDKEGNSYKTWFKNGKVISMFDKDGKYKKWESEKYEKVAYVFNLDNEFYKKGMAKIAFNFAVYSDVEVNKLNRVFDSKNKELMNKPIVIPFVPMTLFDSIIESQDTYELFHVLRLFNYKNFLYACIELFSTFQVYVLLVPMTLFDSIIESQDTYELFHVLRLFNYKNFLYACIELFSTFQVYVLLPDDFSGEIYKEYCQVINKNDSEKHKNELMDSLNILDYKDADIIATQYHI